MKRLLLPLLLSLSAAAGDQPQWGTAWSRNMVSPETGLPAKIDFPSSTGILWKVPLGSETHSSPVVSDGILFFGNRKGGFLILAADRAAPRILSESHAGAPISATACAAQHRLYIATMNTLFCAGTP
jgi:hypothetical protein